MKKTNSLFLSAVFCAAVLCGTGCKNNRTEKAVTGAAGTFTMVTVQEKTKYADINVQYPQFPGYAPLNKIISRSILGPYKDFRSTVKQGWTEMNDIRSGSGTDAGMPPFSYDVVCKPVIYNDRYISMLFITYAMEGGAHGDTTLSSFTYDRKRNTIVSISEAAGYSLEELSAYCGGYFTKNLNYGDGSKESQEECAKWIADGTAPEKKNYEKFTFDGTTLTVYFEPYIVAPYVYGIQKVELPAK
jgi:Protein of unknown function (DUF3298).